MRFDVTKVRECTESAVQAKGCTNVKGFNRQTR